MQQDLVDGIGSTFQADQPAAASHKGVYSFQGDVLLSQFAQYGLFAIRKLVADLAKLLELGSVMRDVDGKDLLVIKADIRRPEYQGADTNDAEKRGHGDAVIFLRVPASPHHRVVRKA